MCEPIVQGYCNSKGIIHSTNSSDNSWPGDAGRAQCTLFDPQEYQGWQLQDYCISPPFPLTYSRQASRHLPGQSLEQATAGHHRANIDFTRWQLKITYQRPQVRQGRPLSCVVYPRLPPQGLVSHCPSSLLKKIFLATPHSTWDRFPNHNGTCALHWKARVLNPLTCQESPDFFLIEIYLI